MMGTGTPACRNYDVCSEEQKSDPGTLSTYSYTNSDADLCALRIAAGNSAGASTRRNSVCGICEDEVVAGDTVLFHGKAMACCKRKRAFAVLQQA
jgi:hypothetical protein